MSQAVAAQKSNPAQPTKQKPDLLSLLGSQAVLKQIERALPKHLSADRIARIATTEVTRNPKLKECDPMSFIGSLLLCSELGLEPGSARGHVYLIPFYNSKRSCYEVQVVPGFKGLMDLARRSGQISSIDAAVVYEKDLFDYELGMRKRLRHKKHEGDDPGPIKYAYAIAKLKDGGWQFEVLTKAQVDKVRDGLKNKNPVWNDHYEEMARKTAIRRLYKYLPSSPEMAKVADTYDASYSAEPQENYLLVDPTYKPEPIANDLREAQADAKAESLEKQKEAVLEKIESELVVLSKEQNKEASLIAKEVGVKDLGLLPSMEPERLQAIFEALRDMGGGLRADEIPFGQ